MQMPKYSPEPLEFATTEFNPNQYSFQTAKADGIYMGRLLMRDELLTLIKATNPAPTKAVVKIIEIIEQIRIDTYANDSSR